MVSTVDQSLSKHLNRMYLGQVSRWLRDTETKGAESWATSYKPVYPWGRGSVNVLATLRPELVHMCNNLGDIMNVSLLSGYRNHKEQTELHELNPVGALPWPTSKHNRYPSEAVDIAPYPIDWDDLSRFDEMIGICKGIAKMGGYEIVSGKYFSNVADYPHIELVTKL